MERKIDFRESSPETELERRERLEVYRDGCCRNGTSAGSTENEGQDSLVSLSQESWPGTDARFPYLPGVNAAETRDLRWHDNLAQQDVSTRTA